MTLTPEQIEKLRAKFEAQHRSIEPYSDIIFARFAVGPYQNALIENRWQGYLAHAAMMMGEESVERAARATCLSNASDEVWRLVKGDGKQVAIGIARATILAAMFGDGGMSLEPLLGIGVHDWFTPSFLKYECCRKCGIIRRADDRNKPCRGKVVMSLRDEYTEGGAS